MKSFQVRKYNDTKNKESFTTVVASDEAQAIEKALADMRNPDGYKVEILKAKKAKPVSKLKDLQNRKPGVTPQYGDYEATGWMDK